MKKNQTVNQLLIFTGFILSAKIFRLFKYRFFHIEQLIKFMPPEHLRSFFLIICAGLSGFGFRPDRSV